MTPAPADPGASGSPLGEPVPARPLPRLPVLGRLGARPVPRSRGAAAALAAAGTTAHAAGVAGRKAWDALVEVIPRVPVRDLATLRAHYGGLEGEELADALVRSAAATVAAVGLTGGVVAVSQRKVPSWWVTIPVTLATEITIVAAVEAKLVAELHEVYGVPLRPGSRTRAGAALAEWAARRDIDPTDPRSLRIIAGFALRQRGARKSVGATRVSARVGSAVVGGVAGATTHRRNLADLAESVRADLRASRRRRIPLESWPW